MAVNDDSNSSQNVAAALVIVELDEGTIFLGHYLTLKAFVFSAK